MPRHTGARTKTLEDVLEGAKSAAINYKGEVEFMVDNATYKAPSPFIITCFNGILPSGLKITLADSHTLPDGSRTPARTRFYMPPEQFETFLNGVGKAFSQRTKKEEFKNFDRVKQEYITPALNRINGQVTTTTVITQPIQSSGVGRTLPPLSPLSSGNDLPQLSEQTIPTIPPIHTEPTLPSVTEILNNGPKDPTEVLKRLKASEKPSLPSFRKLVSSTPSTNTPKTITGGKRTLEELANDTTPLLKKLRLNTEGWSRF